MTKKRRIQFLIAKLRAQANRLIDTCEMIENEATKNFSKEEIESLEKTIYLGGDYE